ncbi:MAG: hypothetical protein FJZ96_11465 [Chloroflexi bacterium]|nr:hypothetical protein [Chloroflexota bacterium]
MKPIPRNYCGEDDFWRIRRFLQEVFLLNNRLEHSWHVARWEYLRWPMIENCHICGPLEEVASLWETPGGQIAAVVNHRTRRGFHPYPPVLLHQCTA